MDDILLTLKRLNCTHTKLKQDNPTLIYEFEKILQTNLHYK